MKEGFKVLGTYVAFGGGFDIELGNRLARAHRAFLANWDLLGCATIPIAKKTSSIQVSSGLVGVFGVRDPGA